jgi:hypothetical protein
MQVSEVIGEVDVVPDARTAFTSYACFNDEQDKEQLFMLLERLSTEVKAQTGHEFKIFQDGHDTAWRQNWEQRINEGGNDEPAAASLLLVTITPSLFSCDVCHDQVQWFLDRERARGQQDLIWPIYYITAREMDDHLLRKSDQMVRTLASRRRSDWRELRFEPFTSSVTRKEIALLASRMRDTLWPPPAAGWSGKVRNWLAARTGWVPILLGIAAALVILAVLGIIEVFLPRHGGSTGSTKGNPDATVFISTLILIYTVFIAVYGALMPLVLARPNRDTWKWLAVALIGIAVIFDLVRIQNSLGDLYTTTLRGLTLPKINDVNSEFIHFYFYGNVAVIAIALWIVCMAPRAGPADKSG